jgi:hypothetical protein
MKRVYRDVVYVLLLPLVAGAFYWETKQKMSATGHNLTLVAIVLAFCGLAAAWNRYDETRRLRELLDAMQATGRSMERYPVAVELRDPLDAGEVWRRWYVEDVHKAGNDGHAVVLRHLDTPRK